MIWPYMEELHDSTNAKVMKVDFPEMFVMHERILLLPKMNRVKSVFLNTLGEIYKQCYDTTHDMKGLCQAICLYDDAIRDGMDDNPEYFNDLGTSLAARYKQIGNLMDINKSISMFEYAVQLTPDGHSSKPSWLNNLGLAFLHRFERLGDLSDLNKSVSMKEHAVQLIPDSHPYKHSILNNLGLALSSRFYRLGDLDDLNNAVLILEHAFQLTPDGHPEKPVRLNNLGHSLLSRFERLGDLDDIDKSILLKEHAVQLIPDGHLDKPQLLDNLGQSLLSRFKRLGELRDINKSILTFEHAVHLTPDSYPAKRLWLSALGQSLLRRFERLGDLGDIKQSILMGEHAVQLTPDGHPDKPSLLNNLGMSLLRCFKRFGDLSNMNKSVSMFEHAVQLIPDSHPFKPAMLNNLGNSLLACFDRLGDLDKIQKSISMCEHAVQLAPDGHPDKPTWLNGLGNSLMRCFDRLDNIDDINKSISTLEHAVQLTPDGHPDKPSWLNNLGHSLLRCFVRLSDISYLEAALSHFSSSASSGTGSISVQFESSSMWATCAHLSKNHSPLDAYKVAFQLLPQLAWLGLSISDRHHQLVKAGAVVRDAVASAIAAEQYDTAIEWLEQGRSIVWGQLLQLRNPVDDLKDKHPDLATKLQHISRLLEGTSDKSDFQLPGTTIQPLLNESAKQYHDLADKRDELLKTIQKIPGFETFLLPKAFSQLIPAACGGPVITVNVSQARCDALILLPDLEDVLHIPLPNFTYLDAEDLKRSLYDILKNKGVLRDSDRHGRPDNHNLANMEQKFANILSQLWYNIAKPILDGMAIMVCILSMLAIQISLLNIWSRTH